MRLEWAVQQKQAQTEKVSVRSVWDVIVFEGQLAFFPTDSFFTIAKGPASSMNGSMVSVKKGSPCTKAVELFFFCIIGIIFTWKWRRRVGRERRGMAGVKASCAAWSCLRWKRYQVRNKQHILFPSFPVRLFQPCGVRADVAVYSAVLREVYMRIKRIDSGLLALWRLIHNLSHPHTHTRPADTWPLQGAEWRRPDQTLLPITEHPPF